LLRELFDAMGIRARAFMGECDLQAFGQALPEWVQVAEPTRDFHNFLKLKIDGRWLIVDASFGKNEESLGFENNLDWAADTDCRLLFPATHATEVEDLFAAKRAAVAALPAPERARRDAFFGRLQQFLEVRGTQ